MNIEANGIKWRYKNGQTSNGMQNRLEVYLPGEDKAVYLPLGFNLSEEQKAFAAQEVLRDQALKAKLVVPKGQATCLADLWAGYVAEVKNDKKREPNKNDKQRFDTVILRILGGMPLKDMNTRQMGMFYIETRRNEGKAEGTIAREMHIINAVMRVAEKNELIDRNRLRDVAIPVGNERKLAVPVSIILEILPYCSRQVQRVVIVALNTLQREEKLWGLQRAGIFKHEDATIGTMLRVGKPKTAGQRKVIKDNLEEMPINKWTYMALTEDGVRQIHGTGRVFDNWATPRNMGEAFRVASMRAKEQSQVYREWCERKGIDHVVLHDLRKTGRTALTDYKSYAIEYATGEVMLGHSLGKVEGLYQASWDWKLKQAVDALEDTYRPLAVYMGYVEGAQTNVRTPHTAAV